MTVLVTGIAGFIGFHLARRLLERGDRVVGIDSINDYYDVNLKYARLAELGVSKKGVDTGRLVSSTRYGALQCLKTRLEDADSIRGVFNDVGPQRVCNLAAQAGVRYSLTNPHAYISANVEGFLNVLEASRNNRIEHLVYASSSSVYGIERSMPYAEKNSSDHPASFYAVTKRANELMAHSYSHLFGIPTTGLRFFTVYGPWGRPDMALFLFAKAILNDDPIEVFNRGEMERDFTYIDDIVEGIIRTLDFVPRENPNWDGTTSGASSAPARVYNIGNGAPVRLTEFIDAIESELGKTAHRNMLPMQPGDVPKTWADCSALKADTGYAPQTDIREGIARFVAWYRRYYEK